MPRKRSPAPNRSKDAPATSHEQDVRWVMSRLKSTGNPPKESEAPSDEAWTMYEIASIDEKSRAAFLDKAYLKLFSKEKPTEAGQKYADDKRKHFTLFQALETERPDLLNESFPRTKTDDRTEVGPDSTAVPQAADAASAEVALSV